VLGLVSAKVDASQVEVIDFLESIMRKNRIVGLALVGLLLALSGCDKWMDKGAGRTKKRDVSTPAARLLGHWQMYSLGDNPTIELYFGPLDQDSGIGTFVLIDPEAGRINHTYRLLEDRERRDEVIITHYVTANKGKEERLFLHKDGENGYYHRNFLGEVVKQRIKYINQDSAPDKRK